MLIKYLKLKMPSLANYNILNIAKIEKVPYLRILCYLRKH